ncbi:hypothetical protein K1719_037321 [Acacia pycnantha]|nr:hypothetical protein K1719_037321 [Acacia pycnantha]
MKNKPRLSLQDPTPESGNAAIDLRTVRCGNVLEDMIAMMKSSRKILAMKKNIIFRSSTSKPKLQLRSVKPKADWSDEMGIHIQGSLAGRLDAVELFDVYKHLKALGYIVGVEEKSLFTDVVRYAVCNVN